MRKVLSLFFVVFFVTPLILTTLVILPVRAWLFNREFYYAALSGEQMLKALEGINLPIPSDSSLPISPEIMDALLVSLATVISPEYLDSQLQPLIDNGLEILEGKADGIDIIINLIPLKNAIQNEKKSEFIQALTTNFPVCESEQAPSLSQLLVVCRPESISTETFAQNIIEPILPQLINFMPDNHPIQIPVKLPIKKLFFWTSLLPNLSPPTFLTMAVIIITVFALIFWILAALIADNSWHVRLKWLGGALIFPALMVLLVAGIVYLFTIGNILTWIMNLMGVKISIVVISSLLTFIGHLALKIAQSFLVSGSIAMGLAIVLITLGKIVKPHQAEVEETE